MMIQLLKITFPQWDVDLFLYLNSKHVEWLNPIMTVVSSGITWMLLCLCLVLYLIWTDRRCGVVGSFFLLLGIGINTLTNNVVKLLFMRPRPGHEPFMQDIIHQLEDAGTHYSFFSAHSSNSICLALFVAFYFKNKYYTFCLVTWALIVAYSRIYVGKHYPLDVICGLLYGIFTGLLSYWLYRQYCFRKGIRCGRDF